jgi:hypothetical protein
MPARLGEPKMIRRSAYLVVSRVLQVIIESTGGKYLGIDFRQESPCVSSSECHHDAAQNWSRDCPSRISQPQKRRRSFLSKPLMVACVRQKQ